MKGECEDEGYMGTMVNTHYGLGVLDGYNNSKNGMRSTVVKLPWGVLFQPIVNKVTETK